MNTILLLIALFGGTLAIQVTFVSVEYITRKVGVWLKARRQ